MGRQKYQKLFVLPDQTARLAIPELAVIKDNAPIASYEVVHQRYFSRGYPICPKCGGTNTRPLKVVDRQLKDIVGRQEKASDVIDLIFHQRYYRCLTCGNRVFPEKVSFAEPGVHFTNRLSDILADGTLLQSYEKVCKEYGVPASKASVGSIMRRRLQFRMNQLPPLKTPRAIAIFVVRFYREEYPVILSLDDHTVRFIDILPGSSAAAYSAFFSGLDRSQVKQILIDPDEQLLSSTHTAFPNGIIAVSKECIQRFTRKAFKEVFQVEAKHCSGPSGDIARLNGCRLLQMAEPPKSMKLDVALLKTLIGRDDITARYLHENDYEFKPVFKLFVNTNYLPLVSDDTLFASERVKVITFDRHFESNEQDQGLKDVLKSSEVLSGILNWILQGNKQYRESHGVIHIPSSVIEETEKYRRYSDKLELFLMDFAAENTTSLYACSNLYVKYVEWCKDNNYYLNGKHSFLSGIRKKKGYQSTGTIDGKTVKNVFHIEPGD